MGNLIIVIVLALAGYAAYAAYTASQAESREARTVKSLPPSAQHVVAQMDATTQAAFFNEYEQRRRKTSLAYVCWMLCDCHFLYLRKLPLQILFWCTFGGFGFWAFYNLFTMRSQVAQANEQIARECLQTLHVGVAFAQMTGQNATQALVTGAASVAAAADTGPAEPRSLPAPSAADATRPPGWEADPQRRHELRYWDGDGWTDHVMDGPRQSQDPYQ